jgi:exopolysaccharide biosynthesis polyprenyl glycosylphosphotransferase
MSRVGKLGLGVLKRPTEAPVPASGAELLPTTDRHIAAPSALRGFRAVGLGLAISDVLCVLAALAVVYFVRGHDRTEAGFLGVMAIAPLVWLGVFHAFGLYGVQHLSASEEFRRIISGTAVGIVLLMVGSFWWHESLSRSWLGWSWSFALLFELGNRRLWRWHVHRLKRKGVLTFRTLVVGTTDEADRLARALESPAGGFVPIGYVATTGTHSPDGIPVLGNIAQLGALIRTHDIECVFVASTAVTAEDMLWITRTCRQANVEMRVSANLPDILTSRVAIQPIDEVMALSVKPVRLTGARAVLKRSFDLVFGSLVFFLLLPVMGLVALAIRMTSPGPVLFRQERVTKHGRAFVMYKFRTMVTDPDQAFADRVVDLTRPFFKLQDDPRLTPIGRVLRPISLDELPQLWNVIRGDMSLVGPRPLPAEQVAAHLELLGPRHEVRAGITGWWQIRGRSELEYEEALRLDLFYIENWSLSLDLYILLKTLGALVVRRGAY